MQLGLEDQIKNSTILRILKLFWIVILGLWSEIWIFLEGEKWRGGLRLENKINETSIKKGKIGRGL